VWEECGETGGTDIILLLSSCFSFFLILALILLLSDKEKRGLDRILN